MSTLLLLLILLFIVRGSKSRESGKQTVRRLRWMMFRVVMARDRICEKAVFSVLSGRPVER